MVLITSPPVFWGEEHDLQHQSEPAVVHSPPSEHHLPDGEQNQSCCQTTAQGQALMPGFQTQAHHRPREAISFSSQLSVANIQDPEVSLDFRNVQRNPGHTVQV